MMVLGLLLQAQADAQAQVGAGQVTGGWNYIWLAYGVTWTAIAAYALSLWLRRPSRQQEDA